MNGDIKTNIEILNYPKVNEFNSVTSEEIIKYIYSFKHYKNKFKENRDYYIGKNTAIINKKKVDYNNPDSRISVCYARTLTSIVKGYMFKPGLIEYNSEEKEYYSRIQEIYKINNEPLKTSEVGESQSKYGIGIELVYTNKMEKNNEISSMVYFCNIDPSEVILIYNNNIEPELIGTIRYYLIEETDEYKKYKIDVYFIDRIEIYEMIDEKKSKKSISLIEIHENIFKDIPFCVYKNNTECNADYEPVKPLIDAYDTMISDSLNEINRFANAYLILKNFILANADDEAGVELELEKLKTRRIFQFIGDNGGAEFLTKNIPSEFFDSLKMTLREDIQYHSHIPDFRDKNFQSASGVSLLYSLFDFENLCSDKQALFEVGLRQRIRLINKFLKFNAVDSEDVNIKFSRNLPVNISEKVSNFAQLAQTNKIADEDLLKLLPADIIPDIQSALERIKKQKEENMSMFDLDKMNPNLNKEETNNVT